MKRMMEILTASGEGFTLQEREVAFVVVSAFLLLALFAGMLS